MNSETGSRLLCRLFQTCSGLAAIERRRLSGRLRSIRRTVLLPVSTAVSQNMTPDFTSLRGRTKRFCRQDGRASRGSRNDWLAHNPKGPFFLWVHLNDPRRRPRFLLQCRSERGADAAVGKLVAALRGSKLYDDALIVVASDHGESLGSHGEDTHGVFLYDETIHVPCCSSCRKAITAGKRVRPMPVWWTLRPQYWKLRA